MAMADPFAVLSGRESPDRFSRPNLPHMHLKVELARRSDGGHTGGVTVAVSVQFVLA